MKMLTRLVYASRIAPELEGDLERQVREILDVSRRNNSRSGVTGMLLTHGGFFVQALEGEDDAVQATLARVSADARHDQVRVLGRHFAPERAFGVWSMCANTLSSADEAILRVLGSRAAFDPHAIKPADVFRLLGVIADIQTRRREALAAVG